MLAHPSFHYPGPQHMPSPDFDMDHGSINVAHSAETGREEQIFWPDVEMEDMTASRPEYFYSDIAPASASCSGRQRFLTVDTNLLLNHLPLVEKVLIAMVEYKQNPVSLLIPTVVVAELEKKASTSPSQAPPNAIDRNRMLGARKATKWLLSVKQQRRGAAMRFQQWTERGPREMLPELPTADDRILDCALFFQRKYGGEVMLWSEDNNLALKSEANEIRAVPAPTPGLGAVLRHCGILPVDSPSLALDAYTPHLAQSHTAPNDSASDGGMEIDADFLPPPQAPQRPLQTIINTPKRHHPTPHRSPTSPSNRRTPLPSLSRPGPPSRISRPPIPSDILARLTLLGTVLSPFFAPAPSPPPVHPSTPTAISTRRALDTLDAALASRDSGPDRPLIFRLRFCIMTLANWVYPASTTSQQGVLSSDAARDLEGMLKVLPQIEVSLDRADEWDEVLRRVGEYREVVDLIRAL